MSGWNQQISDWEQQGLDWQYVNQSIMRIFEIPANSHYQLPRQDFTFDYPEGVIIQFTAGFDNPLCGIRIESDPNFDTEELFTVNSVSLAGARPEILTYAIIPPATIPGLFLVRICSPWTWKNWLRLYLINTDSTPHRVIGHSYHIAVLKEKRPEPA